MTKANLKVKGKQLMTMGATALSTMAIAIPTFAATNLDSIFTTALNNIITLLQDVANPCFALAFTVCLLSLLFGRSGKSADTAFSWAKAIIIGFVGINVLQSILDFCVKNLAGEGNGYVTEAAKTAIATIL